MSTFSTTTNITKITSMTKSDLTKPSEQFTAPGTHPATWTATADSLLTTDPTEITTTPPMTNLPLECSGVPKVYTASRGVIFLPDEEKTEEAILPDNVVCEWVIIAESNKVSLIFVLKSENVFLYKSCSLARMIARRCRLCGRKPDYREKPHVVEQVTT